MMRRSEMKLKKMLLLCVALLLAACTQQGGTGGTNTANSGGANTSGGGAAAGAAKRLAFVTNNPSDFWTIARKGVEKADGELAEVTAEFKMPPNGTAAEQRQIID